MNNESWLKVRMEPQIIERIKAFVGDEKTGGRAGGVSLFIRALIYPKIGVPLTNQRWRNEFDIPEIDKLEQRVNEWWRIATTTPARGEKPDHPSKLQLERCFQESLAIAKTFFQNRDLINQCRAEHLVSRMALLRNFYCEWRG